MSGHLGGDIRYRFILTGVYRSINLKLEYFKQLIFQKSCRTLLKRDKKLGESMYPKKTVYDPVLYTDQFYEKSNWLNLVTKQYISTCRSRTSGTGIEAVHFTRCSYNSFARVQIDDQSMQSKYVFSKAFKYFKL